MKHLKKTLIGSAALALAGMSIAIALTLSNQQDAKEVIGRSDFTTGFIPFGDHLFFGAEEAPAGQSAVSNRFFVTSGMDYDAANKRLFATDVHNHRILIFDISSGISADMQPIHVLGQPDKITGAVDPLSPYGAFNTQNAANGCTTAINACGMTRAIDLAYDPNNDLLYVTDADNRRILVWDVNPLTLTDGQAAQYVLGQSDFTSKLANADCLGGTSALPTACSMTYPWVLEYDSVNNLLYTSGNESRILVFDMSSGVSTGMLASKVLGQPTFTSKVRNKACPGGTDGIANKCGLQRALNSILFDFTGNRLFVADGGNNRTIVYDLSGGIINGMEATHVIGQPDFVTRTTDTACGGGSSGSANACGMGPFAAPHGLALDEETETLYVSDGWNHRVLEFDVSALPIEGQEPFNLPASKVLGQSDFVTGMFNDPVYGAVNPPTASSISGGSNVTFIKELDALLLADSGNHRILVFRDPLPANSDSATITQTVNATENEVTLDVVAIDGTSFGVTMPDETTASGTNDLIQVEVVGGSHPSITIDADLPAGTSKSVVIDWTNSPLCIVDSPNAVVGDNGNCGGVTVKSGGIKDVGDCQDWSTVPVSACIASSTKTATRLSATSVEVAGLENSALYYVVDSDGDGVSENNDLCPGTDLNGPIPTSSLRSNHTGDDVALAGGCNCSQILAGLGINGNGPRKFGCTPGIINRWSNQ